MDSHGTSWADQWDHQPDPSPAVWQQKKNNGGGGGGKYKEKVGVGFDKTKSVASTGFKKVKEGTSVGFRWIKDKGSPSTNNDDDSWMLSFSEDSSSRASFSGTSVARVRESASKLLPEYTIGYDYEEYYRGKLKHESVDSLLDKEWLRLCGFIPKPNTRRLISIQRNREKKKAFLKTAPSKRARASADLPDASPPLDVVSQDPSPPPPPLRSDVPVDLTGANSDNGSSSGPSRKPAEGSQHQGAFSPGRIGGFYVLQRTQLHEVL
ncbi:hypothetical protein JRO89_XS13G0187100 [Xanthoceras sorbifolium]|uniref:Uncharacterized protein n=1 Tax=Xanthoceras sorbifolium TaxID=99658 RepID=A0ABQ8H914_9ROSI|nr:hypothetical protein JRO89_XS13G0187100 [Xanthoceras sorbifolium]